MTTDNVTHNYKIQKRHRLLQRYSHDTEHFLTAIN
jgi:hypothetical protein